MNKTMNLFGNHSGLDLTTEGPKYIGSKNKIIPYILELIKSTNAYHILDGFSGTSRVSQALAKNGFDVISNDIATWSYYFSNCYLNSKNDSTHYRELIHHLNSLTPVEGWFTSHYGGTVNNISSIQNDGCKRPWQIHNTKKLDAIREEIDKLELDDVDKSVTLTSLILALDKVDNTLGHHVSYLKNWSARSYNKLELKTPLLFYKEKKHDIYQDDIFDILSNISGDLAYFDPPYGSNNEKMPPSRVRYNSYYHIWTTICLNDRPKLFGKAKRREESSDNLNSSVFEDFRKDQNGRFIVVNAIDQLIKNARFNWIILSYSSGGRATATELNEVIQKNGKLVKTIELDYKKNVMSSMSWTNEWIKSVHEPNKEYLFLIKK